MRGEEGREPTGGDGGRAGVGSGKGGGGTASGVRAGTDGGDWKSQYQQVNRKLQALRVEAKAGRSREIARLKSLLETQGIDPRQRSVGGRLEWSTDPPAQVPATLKEARPLQSAPVFGGTDAGALWNAFIDRYHYLGYRPLSGSQMRYTVSDRHGTPLAFLGFEAAAWKTAPRDAFIGWSPTQRQRQLPLVVNNARFLILPWAHLPNLASHLLSRLHQQLPDDWQNRYTFRPVLLETFCEIPRFHGTVYRAANWTRIGQTQGIGLIRLEGATVDCERAQSQRRHSRDITYQQLQNQY